MDVARPYSAVAPSLDGEVLVVLAGTTKPMSTRRISQLVKHGSYGGVKKAVERLVEQGLVSRETAGNAHLHLLNREHLAAPIVDAMAGLRSAFLSRLREGFSTWAPPPLHASLFGSAARGDGDTHSDIDLFIVRPSEVDDEDPVWREQFATISEQILAWTGNRAGPVEVSQADLADLLQANPSVLRDLREHGIALAGVPISSVLGDAS